MNNFKIYVKKNIDNNNPWYTASQFEYAELDGVKRSMESRFLFFYKIIRRELLLKKKIKILDYGCGDGYWASVFSDFKNCSVTGLDYNELRLKRARSKVKGAKFIEFDITKINKEIGLFDIVFCSQVIEHIKDDLGFIINIKKYLKKDGILIIGTPNEGCLNIVIGRRIYRIARIIKNYIKFIIKKPMKFYSFADFKRTIDFPKTDHVHFYREKEIVNKIKDAGFFIADIYREVFAIGIDRLQYKLTSTDIGFKLLQILSKLMPSQCAGYYFECRLSKPNFID